MSESHSTRPCRVTFKLTGPQSVPGAFSLPPAHHLPSRVPAAQAPAPRLIALHPCAGGGALAVSDILDNSTAETEKPRCAYQVRALSLAPPASRFPWLSALS